MTDSKLQNSTDENTPTAGSLGLRIPEQLPAPADSFLHDPRDTAQWIESLPMANIGETARRVYRTLIDFNRYQLNDMLRAKLVEQFRAPTEYVCDNLKRHYMDVSFPLPEKAWKTASLSRELNAELSISYKIIIERMLAGKADRFDRKLLVIAMHRAMYYLGQVLLQTAVTYAPWVKGLWKEINTLYAYAQQNRVHQVPIKMKVDDRELITTLEDQYKALLLLAAATPYRLRQKQIVRLFEEARSWASLVELHSPEDIESGNGRLTINLASDEPPVHSTLREAEIGRNILMVDTRPLLKKLQEDFESAPWESTADLHGTNKPLTKPLLRQLIIAWNKPPDRRFVRTRLNFELNILVGLTAIHEGASVPSDEELPEDSADAANIALDNPFLPDSDENLLSPSSAATKTSVSELNPSNMSVGGLDDQPLSNSPDSLMADSLLDSSLSSNNADDDWPKKPRHAVNPDADTIAVTTKNESAGGYCIRWSVAGNAPKVKVGELVGIASPTHRRQFTLGVVRWLRLHGGQDLDLGLQIIASNVEAAQLRFAETQTSRRSGNAPVDCLLLPAIENDPSADAASLIVSNAIFPLGSKLLLNQSGHEKLVKLTSIVEFNSAFVRFQFTTMKKEEKNEAPSKTSFDDLWNNL